MMKRCVQKAEHELNRKTTSGESSKSIFEALNSVTAGEIHTEKQ